MKNKFSEVRITHLKCREIQAPIVSSLIQRFAEEIGSDKTIEVAKKVINKDAIESGKKLAQEFLGNTKKEFDLKHSSKISEKGWDLYFEYNS